MNNLHSFSCFLSPRAPLLPDSLCWGRQWQLEGAVPPNLSSLSWPLALIRPTYIPLPPTLLLDFRTFHSYSAQSSIWPLAISDLTRLSQRPMWSKSCQGRLKDFLAELTFPWNLWHFCLSPPSTSRSCQQGEAEVTQSSLNYYMTKTLNKQKNCLSLLPPTQSPQISCYPFFFLQGN